MRIRTSIEHELGRLQYRLLTRALARASGFVEDSAVLEDVKVPFFVRGHGAPVVLLHGFGGDKESWLLFAVRLAKKRMVVIPDLPGFGEAGAIPPERASAKQQARAVVKLLDRLGLGRVHLVGNSMGGGIAMRVAFDAPERVQSLGLLCSVGPIVDKSFVARSLDEGRNPLIIERPEDFTDLLTLVAHKRPLSTRAVRAFLGTRASRRREALHALFRGWNRPHEDEGLPKPLASVTAPALVVHGALDRVIDVSTGRALARELAAARLVVYEDVGHVPQIEAPARTARLVDAFLAEHDR